MSKLPSTMCDLLRPKSLADLTADPVIVARLTKMVETGSPMNMLFYGRSGIGKTSAARILIRELNADSLELNGASNNSDREFINKIVGFGSTISLNSNIKICFIDEAENMTRFTQASLRHTIEKFSNNVRFIMTANSLRKIDPAIQSRCIPMCFDVTFGRQREVIDRLTVSYRQRLSALGHELETDVIRRIVVNYFPDMRKIADNFHSEILGSEPIAAVAA